MRSATTDSQPDFCRERRGEQMTKRKEKQLAHVTVAELRTTLGVPLHVQVWLDRFARGDEHALDTFGFPDWPGINETAFLIYDVLEAQRRGRAGVVRGC